MKTFRRYLWPVWPFLNGGLCSSTNTGLATPTAERSGLAWTSCLPSLLWLPQASDHNHRECLSSFFFANLVTVCPLASICTGMNNPVLEDYSNLTFFYDARRLERSQPACIALSTPTGIPELRGANEQARQNKIYKPSLWNLNSTHTKE